MEFETELNRERNVSICLESCLCDRSLVVVDRQMEKAVAYAISAALVGIGVLILVVGLSSSSPALWVMVALVPITIGIVSAFGPV
jgi:hypothetical protein